MLRAGRDLPHLQDSDLDRWLAEWRTSPNRLVAPIHGDYWCRNLIVTDPGGACVIDWDDARIGSVDRGLAWADWEFSADRGTNSLGLMRASRFLDVYDINGGPVQGADRSYVIPLIREHLRYQIRRALEVTPISRPVQRIGHIVSQALVGGLHHQYVRI